MFKPLLLSIMMLFSLVSTAQSTLVGITDDAGMARIEKELRVKIVKVSDNVLQFTFEKEEERRINISIETPRKSLSGVEPTKENGIWKVDLSTLFNGSHVIVIYDFDANKKAQIKVSRKGKRKKYAILATP